MRFGCPRRCRDERSRFEELAAEAPAHEGGDRFLTDWQQGRTKGRVTVAASRTRELRRREEMRRESAGDEPPFAHDERVAAPHWRRRARRMPRSRVGMDQGVASVLFGRSLEASRRGGGIHHARAPDLERAATSRRLAERYAVSAPFPAPSPEHDIRCHCDTFHLRAFRPATPSWRGLSRGELIAVGRRACRNLAASVAVMRGTVRAARSCAAAISRPWVPGRASARSISSAACRSEPPAPMPSASAYPPDEGSPRPSAWQWPLRKPRRVGEAIGREVRAREQRQARRRADFVKVTNELSARPARSPGLGARECGATRAKCAGIAEDGIEPNAAHRQRDHNRDRRARGEPDGRTGVSSPVSASRRRSTSSVARRCSRRKAALECSRRARRSRLASALR